MKIKLEFAQRTWRCITGILEGPTFAILLGCLVLSLTACSHVVHVDAVEQAELEVVKYGSGMLVTPSQTSDFVDVKYEGISYRIAYDSNRLVNHIETYDSGFESPEGIDMSDSFGDIEEEFGESSYVMLKGWASYFRLPSGWNVGFYYWKMPSEIDQKDWKPSFLFKRLNGKKALSLQVVLQNPELLFR